MEIIESILKENPCFKKGKKIVVKGLMLHSVGCPQPSAEVFVRKWNRPEASRACVHAFIDGNTGKVYQTLPWNHRAWHGGGSSNDTHIGVEMCEPACIKYTGGASFTCLDREKAMAVVKRTYDTAVELFAFLCKKFSLNPLADGVIVSHKEGHARGIASGHGDPDHLWKGLQSGYTMDSFRRDVYAAMTTSAQSESAALQSVSEQAGGILQEAPQHPVGRMRISERGVDLVARYEDCRLEAYTCPAGKWTIGYGHTEGVKPGDRLASVEEANELLRKDLEKYSAYVNEFAEKGIISFSLNQNQFDALTSFCYNCGKGNLQNLVSGRDADTVGQKMLLYNKSNGKKLEGLVRRREEESALFKS